MGLSDFQPGRTLLDWPPDVVALADALGLERFGVMGWSVGGQYALACAYAIPERLSVAMTLAGVIPFEVAGTRRDLDPVDRIVLPLCERDTLLAAALFHLSLKRPSPEKLQRSLAKGFTERDKAASRRMGPSGTAVKPFKEAVRCGTQGVVQDY